MRLHEHAYAEKDALELLRLVDWLLPLPEEMTREFRQRLIAYEEEKRMPYVTSYEQIAREEGQHEGRQQGQQERAWEDILAVLDARFGEVPYGLRQQVQRIHEETRLRQLLRSASVVPSLELFRAELQ